MPRTVVLYRCSIEFLLKGVVSDGEGCELVADPPCEISGGVEWQIMGVGKDEKEKKSVLFASGTASLATAHTLTRLMRSHVPEVYCSHAGAPYLHSRSSTSQACIYCITKIRPNVLQHWFPCLRPRHPCFSCISEYRLRHRPPSACG